MCGSSTSEVHAKRMRRCIRTSSLVSTVHRKSFSEVTMVSESTCGVSDASLQSCLLGILFSLVRMSRSNSRVSWRFSAHLRGILLKRPREGSSFSTHHSSLALLYQAKAGGDDPAVRLLAVPSSAMTRPSWTSCLNVFVGILRSVCGQTRPCLTPSSLMSLSKKPGLSVPAQEMQHRLRRRLRSRHHNPPSSEYIQQTRPSRQCHRKQQRRLLARVPCQIPQLQLRVTESQQLLISATS
jgi:hypothetical protein